MSSPWTADRVLTLAPDTASASAGQALAAAKKWTSLGQSERALWGLCQGSGKDPYQTRIDLSEPAFKCSCPSRKFPCKHGIALLLLFAKDERAFKAGAEPGWVADWLAGRTERAEKKSERAAEAESGPLVPADPEAQAKRAAQREARIADGAAECRVWLEDLVRRGLAAAQSEREAFWERAAARMVDAQAPGLARLIRHLPASIASGEGWQSRVLDRLARLHLLLRGAERLDSLPPALAADLRVALGRTQAKEEALAGEVVEDHWCVAGQVIEEEDRLRVRRSWLFGLKTLRRALVLDFAAGAQPLDPSLIAGVGFAGQVAYYPAGLPLRALVKARSGAASAMTGADIAAAPSIEGELTDYAKALASIPWMERWPIVLASAVVIRTGERWALRDSAGHSLPIRPGFAAGWRLLAISRGQPITIMGEWDGEWLSPLGAWSGEGVSFENLAPRWAA